MSTATLPAAAGTATPVIPAPVIPVLTELEQAHNAVQAAQDQLRAATTAPEMEQAQFAVQAAQDQLRAAKRTALIQKWLGLIGAGLTASRLQAGKELWEYAILENTPKTRRELIGCLTLDMINQSKGMLDQRKLDTAVKLYHVSLAVPAIATLNYGVAERFEKVGKLSWDTGVKVGSDCAVKLTQLITDIQAGKACCNANGIVDKSAVGKAIGVIMGKKQKEVKAKPAGTATPAPSVTATPAPSVTSSATVMQWIEASTIEEIVAMLAPCSQTGIEKLTDAIVAAMDERKPAGTAPADQTT